MQKYMKKIALLLMALLVMSVFFAACSKKEEPQEAEPAAASEEAEAQEEAVEEAAEEAAEEVPEGNKYGYAGTDPMELAVYKYMAEVIVKDYGESDCSIPVVYVVDVDDSDANDIKVKGDFWVENYDIEGDTLKCKSGGAHPGCMHMKAGADGSYEVTGFDPVKDGGEYEPSAKEIFGDKYDEFAKIASDQDGREARRFEAVTVYVNANEIPCTKYQDEGWDPIDLHL